MSQNLENSIDMINNWANYASFHNKNLTFCHILQQIPGARKPNVPATMVVI